MRTVILFYFITIISLPSFHYHYGITIIKKFDAILNSDDSKQCDRELYLIVHKTDRRIKMLKPILLKLDLLSSNYLLQLGLGLLLLLGLGLGLLALRLWSKT
jgi:hypothetical protein